MPTVLPHGVIAPGDDPARRLYLRPLAGAEAGERLEILLRRHGGVVSAVAEAPAVAAWARNEGERVAAHVETLIARLEIPAPSFAGLKGARPLIMGVINVTPDSFSDGGETPDTTTAIARGRAMLEAGAAILDVGGESTRPGAAPVPVEDELARVLPVVGALAAEGALVSIDTRRAAVMRAAVAAGARIINDVTSLAGDADSLAVAGQSGAAVVLMHMQGEPRTMQLDPHYDCAPLDIYDTLAGRVAACESAGIPRARIAVDPGIGFGKTVAHNVQVLARLGFYRALGCALVLGVSRKSFIARLARGEPVNQRLGGSLAAGLAAAAQGADILRVHDVGPTRQALEVWRAIADEMARPPVDTRRNLR